MSDTFTDDDQNQPRQVTLARKDVRRLEKQAAEGKEALAELEQLRKERAYVQAGVPLEDKRTPYFMAGYQGEMTPEAIRAKWAEDFGQVQDTGDPAVTDEMRQMQAAQEMVSGGGQLPPDKLAERDAKLAALSQTDPHYPEKFDAIFAEYGGRTGSMVG